MNADMPLLRIVSLGCAKNFVDTEVAAGSLLCAGFGLTADENEADILFLNTCAFLAEARKEAEQEIVRAEKWKARSKHKRRIIVSGCIVEWDKDGQFRAAHPAVDLWSGIDSIADLGKLALSVWESDDNAASGRTAINPERYLYTHQTPRLQLTASHYAYLKVSDGCDNCCTYCKIPSIRGSLRSRRTDDVVAEAAQLIANGVRELIVIAQDTAAFGRDLDGHSHLPELVAGIDALEGDFFFRLMYLHPASVSQELIDAMAQAKHLIPCLEMPLQHISGPVLDAMHRHISEADTRTLIDLLTKKYGFALRTTFMTGFPGETEEDFRKLLEFVQETRFTRLGVFAYSREAGVPAAELPDQITPAVGKARRAKLMKAQAAISAEANLALIGTDIPVIIDEIDGRTAFGRTLFDAPDIDNAVVVSGASKCNPGDLITVRVSSSSEYELRGKLVKPAADKSKKAAD